MEYNIYLHKKAAGSTGTGSFYYARMRFNLVILGLLFSFAGSAQQIPLFSAYSFNKFLVNPAFTGIDNEYRAFGFYRSQWGGMPGRPVTAGATMEGSFWQDRIGGGLQIVNDQIGAFNQTFVDLSYCQKIKLAKDHQLAIGIQGGLLDNRIDFSALQAKDANDPGLSNQRLNQEAFDFTAGISYKWKSLLIGVSVPNILQPDAKYAVSGGTDANFQYVRHYTAFAQYRIGLLNDRFGITPTVFMRKSAISLFQFDGSVLLDYKQIVYAGGGYRTSYGLTAIFGLNILKMFTVAYAYDYTTQPVLNGNVGATHEVTFGFHIGSHFKRKKNETPVTLEPDTVYIQNLQKSNDSLNTALHLCHDSHDTVYQQINNLTATNKATQQQVDSLAHELEEIRTMQRINGIPGVPVSPVMNGGSGASNPTGRSANNEQSFTLDKIYFDFDKYNLLPASKAQLDSLVDFLVRFPNVEIVVNGHTDYMGSPELNMNLSQQRAKSVVDYLIAHGINSKRLSYKGYGKERPVADNSTEAGRQQNRRVEFVIIRK